ncbi:hypothetical protein DLAC_11622 [Tieghemostelium lacteum]|uniref:Transmembrane protein n=1 Tax=Tieghemostelium lacteum TaxID=361077 RepID=A0A151ZJ06_TIELA|nr:hypothetical protein DLAC_11622 [Tieghemostelium lacteum]|eukprot:KYQ93897.1 hypothetical protein DLAC_11622 [Tieghemostelium lacteum]
MAKKKSSTPEICLPGGMCYRFPGPCCSICCMVFSLFGVVGLLIISGLLKDGYKKAEGEAQWTASTEAEAVKTSYIAVAIYGGFIGACLIAFLWRKFTEPKNIEIDDE